MACDGINAIKNPKAVRQDTHASQNTLTLYQKLITKS